MSAPHTLVQPVTCQLESGLLKGFSAPLFRRAEGDGTPVLVVRMGNRDGVVPLRSLQIKLGIEDDSADGRMLDRIGEALDFVHELRPGDPLPAEILTGEASWQPGPAHRHIASQRLRGRLIQWLATIGAPSGHQLVAGDFERMEHDPALAERLHAAFSLIATQLRLPDALDAIALMESLTTELAYIEALRDFLLIPLRGTARKLDLISQGRRGDGMNTDTLIQVRRLCATGLQRIGTRFSAVDKLTEDIVTALSGGPGQQLLIRSNRDWLYRTHRAFASLLTEWESATADIDDDFWNRLSRTYRYLAPRFMSVQEWQQTMRPGGRTGRRSGW